MNAHLIRALIITLGIAPAAPLWAAQVIAAQQLNKGKAKGSTQDTNGSKKEDAETKKTAALEITEQGTVQLEPANSGEKPAQQLQQPVLLTMTQAKQGDSIVPLVQHMPSSPKENGHTTVSVPVQLQLPSTAGKQGQSSGQPVQVGTQLLQFSQTLGSNGSNNNHTQAKANEQVTRLGFLGSLLNVVRYKVTDSCESHFVRNAQGNTIREVLPTGTEQRNEANRVNNELVGKMQTNHAKNYAVRYAAFLDQIDKHEIILGDPEKQIAIAEHQRLLAIIQSNLARLQGTIRRTSGSETPGRQSPSQAHNAGNDHKERAQTNGNANSNANATPLVQQPQQSEKTAVV